MNAGVQAVGPGDEITLDVLLAFHHRLMAAAPGEIGAGTLRTKQNWIGGSDYNPCTAAFVPPPPEYVPELMADLCSFCNEDGLPAVAQAALAHAQFETIHPFADGNGRTGRGLIQLVLRRRGLASRILPPVSLVLATWAKDYLAGLTATRYLGPATGNAAHEGLNLWIGRFAGACIRAVQDAASFEERIQEMEGEWRARLGQVRAGSGTDLLLRALPGAPIVTVASAAELIDRSFPTVNDAIARLTEAGVLKQITIGRRNRAFEAKEVIDAFTSLERQLASPEGDTRSSPRLGLLRRGRRRSTDDAEQATGRSLPGPPTIRRSGATVATAWRRTESVGLGRAVRATRLLGIPTMRCLQATASSSPKSSHAHLAGQGLRTIQQGDSGHCDVRRRPRRVLGSADFSAIRAASCRPTTGRRSRYARTPAALTAGLIGGWSRSREIFGACGQAAGAGYPGCDAAFRVRAGS